MMRVLIVGCLAVGCAESFSPLPDAPIEHDLDRLEMDLSDEEYRALCEVFQRRIGYPETTLRCPDPRLAIGIATPEDCFRRRVPPAEIPDCRMTVGDWFECMAVSEPYWCPPSLPECERPPECGEFRFGIDGTGRGRYIIP